MAEHRTYVVPGHGAVNLVCTCGERCQFDAEANRVWLSDLATAADAHVTTASDSGGSPAPDTGDS